MDNIEMAAIFYEVADILDLQGVPFKPNAYRRAARSIEGLEEPISKLAAEGKLEDLPGVGESLAKKIQEILDTGELTYLKRLRSEVPQGLLQVLKVPDVGPKTVMLLHNELGISNVEQLKKAAEEHKLRDLKGFGEKSEDKILAGIRTLESKGGRMLLGDAYPVAGAYVDYLKSSGSLDLVTVAGSLRRGKETVGDIDILVGDDKPAAVMQAFVSYPDVKEVLMQGPTKSSVLLKNRLQVDIRAVDTRSYGAALAYFTGSKDHNVKMRKIGVDEGLKLNEYGVFERGSGKMIAGATEADVYKALGMEWVPPEIREDTGEVELSRKGIVPELVEPSHIRGDLHVHTDWSDGLPSIQGVAESAIQRGYDYVAITDHSQSLKIANGLTPDRLMKQIVAVRKVQETMDRRITLLAGSEVDIKADGSLDLPSSTLKSLDLVVASVHSRFKMNKQEMTKRIVAAIESGVVHVIGHPTGRIIGQRDPYEFDFEKVFSAAKSSGVCMEVNCFPDRLDLRDVHCRLAKDSHVRVAIGTDAHRVEQLDFIKYGVTTARRGWLSDSDVLNTLGVKDLLKHLKGRRG
ncbi:MAG TPA: DNA polymerase/3'-5' exonuclease PolX [Thermoplasmata archaeon]|nr:DNA polymerase/3'-5' exonuclease PolX [Thermoplasmata archaeon]